MNVAYTAGGQDDDDDGQDSADASGIAWALAKNNYLLNSGMQKIAGQLNLQLSDLIKLLN